MVRDRLFQVRRDLPSCRTDGTDHGPIICRQEFTAVVLIPGKIPKIIITGQLPARTGFSRMKQACLLSHPIISCPKIIPDLVWDKNLPFPLNNTWGYHDAATGNGRYDLYMEEMVKRFGKPSGMEEYCDKMQLDECSWLPGYF